MRPVFVLLCLSLFFNDFPGKEVDLLAVDLLIAYGLMPMIRSNGFILKALKALKVTRGARLHHGLPLIKCFTADVKFSAECSIIIHQS